MNKTAICFHPKTRWRNPVLALPHDVFEGGMGRHLPVIFPSFTRHLIGFYHCEGFPGRFFLYKLFKYYILYTWEEEFHR